MCNTATGSQSVLQKAKVCQSTNKAVSTLCCFKICVLTKYNIMPFSEYYVVKKKTSAPQTPIVSAMPSMLGGGKKPFDYSTHALMP